MDATSKVIEFVSFCIEMYAREYNMTGEVVSSDFEKRGIIDYLFDNYQELHTQGKEFLLPLLHDFITKENQK
jgi:hypothetical protein